jgi:16S rRNA (cytosine967-C5)-methyltransferase
MQLLPMQSLPLAHNRGVLPDGTVQLWTHLDQSDAMFMALLKKVG